MAGNCVNDIQLARKNGIIFSLSRCSDWVVLLFDISPRLVSIKFLMPPFFIRSICYATLLGLPTRCSDEFGFGVSSYWNISSGGG